MRATLLGSLASAQSELRGRDDMSDIRAVFLHSLAVPSAFFLLLPRTISHEIPLQCGLPFKARFVDNHFLRSKEGTETKQSRETG